MKMSNIPWRRRRQVQHMMRPPKLTAKRWCGYCGGKHSGHCQLVQLENGNWTRIELTEEVPNN